MTFWLAWNDTKLIGYKRYVLKGQKNVIAYAIRDSLQGRKGERDRGERPSGEVEINFRKVPFHLAES